MKYAQWVRLHEKGGITAPRINPLPYIHIYKLKTLDFFFIVEKNHSKISSD